MKSISENQNNLNSLDLCLAAYILLDLKATDFATVSPSSAIKTAHIILNKLEDAFAPSVLAMNEATTMLEEHITNIYKHYRGELK